jgi:DNA-binding transcriptional LysR family regulator
MDLRSLRYFAAVVEERHVGRGAARLHMTQPPLSRALRALEEELGTALLIRLPTGVQPTPAGIELYRRAKDVLADVDRLRDAVHRAAGVQTVVIGTLADTTDHLDPALLTAFRRRHPQAQLRTQEYNLSDPTAGVRAGETDLAITRLPFDTRGLRVRQLVTEPVGVVMRRDDPLATAPEVRLDELRGRRWVRLPTTIDPTWREYWTGAESSTDEPQVRTIQECVQAVLLSDRLALAPIGQQVPDPLVIVSTPDRPPSAIAVVWSPSSGPAARAFITAVIEAQARPKFQFDTPISTARAHPDARSNENKAGVARVSPVAFTTSALDHLGGGHIERSAVHRSREPTTSMHAPLQQA